MNAFLNSVGMVLVGFVTLAMSAYLLVNGVRGVQRSHIRLDWRVTIDLVGLQAVMLGSCFAICGVVGAIAMLWAELQLIFANVGVADPIAGNAFRVWTIATGAAGIVAYGTPLYNMYRDASAVSKLVWISVLMIGCCAGLAAWLWIRANP